MHKYLIEIESDYMPDDAEDKKVRDHAARAFVMPLFQRFDVEDIRLVAVDDVYGTHATELELRRP